MLREQCPIGGWNGKQGEKLREVSVGSHYACTLMNGEIVCRDNTNQMCLTRQLQGSLLKSALVGVAMFVAWQTMDLTNVFCSEATIMLKGLRNAKLH